MSSDVQVQVLSSAQLNIHRNSNEFWSAATVPNGAPDLHVTLEVALIGLSVDSRQSIQVGRLLDNLGLTTDLQNAANSPLTCGYVSAWAICPRIAHRFLATAAVHR